MTETIRYRGRAAQTMIYLGKLLRMFIYQNDWKVLPIGAIIAGVVTFVTGTNMFVYQEGTLTGSFALICACIWNGFFNSIQVVCRERGIIKREHRAGLHMSSYIAAQMIYQFFLCAAQTVITLLICRLADIRIPPIGVITPWGLADVAITIMLTTYAADMMALMVSCIVRTTTTAMTVMPFLLIFQLVFSGSFFELSGFAERIEILTISHWGLDSLCAIGRYNELPMVTLWNTLFQFREVTVNGQKPILKAIYTIQEEGGVQEFLKWSGTYSTVDAYINTASNVLHYWLALVILGIVFAAAAVLALEFIDRDKR